MDILEILTGTNGYCIDAQSIPKEYQRKARTLCWKYNQTSPDEGETRAKILQELFGTCHPLTFIEPAFRCDYGFNIHTHGLTIINYNVVILDTSKVEIGENAFIAPGVCISCAGHPIDAKQRGEGLLVSKPINIGRDVWIGANAVICGGVTIGDGTIIGAGAVVTKDVPSGVIAAGSPCRVIREVTEKDRIKKEQITVLTAM